MISDFLDILGISGAILLGIKIFLHIYIRNIYDPKYDPGPGSPFLKVELFLPVFDDVEKEYYWTKKMANIFYTISMISLACFTISQAMMKKAIVIKIPAFT